jgi:rare lipoprotein A
VVHHVLLAAGIASWYDRSSGTITASGQPLIESRATCAMRFVKLGTRVEIIDRANGRRAICVVNDRGPYVDGRVIDVTPAVRDRLHMTDLASVRVYLIP